MTTRWDNLFIWREVVLDRRLTEEDFDVECLPRERVPDALNNLLTDFRHLSHDARESAIRGYYLRNGPPTVDWRLYEMLTKAVWRPGDEPPIRRKVTVSYGGREVVVPLPKGAAISVLTED